jgi:hypothetical protein
MKILKMVSGLVIESFSIESIGRGLILVQLSEVSALNQLAGASTLDELYWTSVLDQLRGVSALDQLPGLQDGSIARGFSPGIEKNN